MKKVFYKQLMYAVCTMLLLFFIFLKFIDYYTLHNKYIILPDFYGVHVDDLDSVITEYKLRYVIIDSIFNKKLDKGMILEQDPVVSTKVKENRRIYLTINALQNKIVIFPDISDFSLRQAVKKLEELDLMVGNLEYKPDLAQNVVLNHKVNGINIEKGQELFVGTTIDLVIGDGFSKKTTTIPNLIGLNKKNAITEIKIASLNLGAIIFDEGIIDSSIAIVYKQQPKVNENRKVRLGTNVDIYLQ